VPQLADLAARLGAGSRLHVLQPLDQTDARLGDRIDEVASEAAATAGGFDFVHTDGLITTITQAQKPGVDLLAVANVYDDEGRVLEQRLPDGDHVSFDYGAFNATTGRQPTQVSWCSNWQATATPPGCAPGASVETATHVHNERGRLVDQVDTNGSASTQTVDDDEVVAHTDRQGTGTATAFDRWGRVVQSATADPATGFVPPLPASAGTELCKRNVDVTFSFPTPGTGNCATRDFTVESYTYCTDTTGAAFDPRVATRTETLGRVTRYLYGSTNPASPCTATLAAQSTPTRVIDPTLAVTDIETVHDGTDDTGLVSKVTDPDLVVSRTTWDTERRLKVADSVGDNWTYYGYDQLGRPVVTRTPLGFETWTVYDGAGRPVETIGPFPGPSTRSCAPATGCGFGVDPDVDGPTTRTQFWLDGSLRSREQRVDRVTSSGRVWDYDVVYQSLLGVSCTPPGVGCERRSIETEPAHGYDPANPTATTRTRRVTRHDSAGRPFATVTSDTASVSAPVSSATTYATNPADAATTLGLGRVAAQTDPAGISTVFGYDENLTASGNGTVSGNGQVTSTGTGATPTGISTSFYDKAGRVIEQRGPAVTDESGAPVASCAHTTFDRGGRVRFEDRGAASATFGSGCVAAGSTSLVRTAFFYDAADRRTHTVVDLDGDGIITDPTTCTASTPVVDPDDVVAETTFTPGGGCRPRSKPRSM